MQQPSIASIVEKISLELNARAVIFLRESGEVIACAGGLEEESIPTLAALISAAASAGKSLAQVSQKIAPKHFHYDFEAGQLYVTAINEDSWLAALHDVVLNPGLFRLQVRRHGQTLGRLSPPVNVAPVGITVTPSATISPSLFANITDDEIYSLFKKPHSRGRT